MDTKQLKAKILDLAIHGKLLPLKTLDGLKNSPDYEPASKLLEKLRAEKEEKIAKGELKRDKKDSYIFTGDDNRHYEKFADGSVKDIEDEIPFEAPEGWAWCRLGDFMTISSAKRVLQKDWKKSGIPFYRAREIAQLSINEKVIDDLFITQDLYEQLKEKYGVPVPGDLMVSAVGTIGKTYIVQDFDCFYYKDASVLCFSKQISEIESKLLKFFIDTPLMQKQIYANSTGTTVDTITITSAENYYIPLPPISEQKLIVAEIEKIFSLIDSIETDKSALLLAVKQAKAKILDLAIHGKLVPQDPADEPASALLEKLRAEKEVKIAKGELKRDKNDSYIYKSTTDNCHYEKFADGTEEEIEVPFEVPDNWTWCHFGDIAEVINGKNQSKVADANGLYPIYGSGGIMGRANDFLCPENCTIIGRKGSINNPIFVEEKFWNVDTAFGLAPTSNVLPKFLFYFCKSFDFTTLDSSTTLPSLTKTSIQQILFPLPSLSEQQRIINRIENLFECLNQIALNLV